MNLTEDTVKLILELKSQGYTRGSIIRAVNKSTKNKELSAQYVDYVINARKNARKNNLDIGVNEARSAFLANGLTSLGCLVLGGIITSITYSMAEPGGTYIATTGLFLVGGITGIAAIVQLVQWLYHLSRRGIVTTGQQTNHRQHSSSNDNEPRSWKDLE